MVSFWIFLAVTIFLSLACATLAYLHFVRNVLPFPDWGNAGFVLPDTRARQALINVLRDVGLSPDYRVDTSDITRAIYRSKFPFILDVASTDAAMRVGSPDSFLAVVVASPAESARRAALQLVQLGFESSAIHDPDSGLSKGKLSVVLSQALPRKMLVFRQHFIKMGNKPPAWYDDEL